MRKSFFKNLFRDIKKTLSRFLSIVIIIAVGVAFYGGVRATSPDMKMSGDLYFRENNLMDFKLISTLGLTKEDIDEFKKVQGITKIEGTYSLDAVMERDGRSQVLNINSLPVKDGINQVMIIEGRAPQNTGEALVEDKFLEGNKLKIGDTIALKSGIEEKLEEKLEITELKIVGTAKSPLYISGQRQLSSVGNGSVRGFVYILPEAFKSEVYTEVYVRTFMNESQNSLLTNEEYSSAIKPIETALKELGPKRGEIRYEEIIKEGTDKLREAEEDLEKGRKEASKKFADAYRQLEDGRKKLISGKAELEKNEKLYYEGIADGEKKIEDGKRQLAEGEAEINSKAVELENGKLQLAEGRKQLEDAEKQLNNGKKLAAEGIDSGMSQKVEEARKKYMEDPLNLVYLYEYTSMRTMYDRYIKGKDYDSMYEGLKRDNLLDQIKPYFDMETLKTEEANLAAAKSELQNNERSLQEGEVQLNAGRRTLEEKKKELIAGEAELNISKVEGLRKLEEGKKSLQEGEAEINKNAEKLKSEEASANQKFVEAEAEIQKNRDKLNDIKKPDFYVLGRNTNVGYETYRQDSDRIGNIGKAFPLIFFLVAALVSLTTMTRMVQDKRVEIGTYKALGYSNAAVVAHYLIYALSASIIGSLIGISIGFRLFPPLIMNAYNSLYAIPYRVAPFSTSIALQASLVAVLFVAAAAALSAIEELREVPASLMRPKPPKSGKRIFLERVTFVWKRLSFTGKVTARNIFRYKQRLIMTVVGIAACTALMIAGFGIREGITGATEAQFSRIYKYDMQASLTNNATEEEKEEMKQSIMKNNNVKSVMFSYSKNATVEIDDVKTQDAYVIVPEESSGLKDYINLTVKGKELELGDEGVILTEKLSRIVNKKVGDTVKITLNDKVMEARVAGITEHFIQHYVYMSPGTYEGLTGEKPAYNNFYGLLNNTSEDSQETTSTDLKGIKNINSIGFKNNVQIDYDDSLESVNSVVLILIISAGVLAFVVIYNLTNINIAERRRELATIKLLGFYNHELAAYIYRENIILTFLGSVSGIFFGIALNQYVLLSAETNIIMFLNKIGPIYFLYSVLLTMLFSMIVNLAMYRRFDKIDMIESLKSVE